MLTPLYGYVYKLDQRSEGDDDSWEVQDSLGEVVAVCWTEQNAIHVAAALNDFAVRGD